LAARTMAATSSLVIIGSAKVECFILGVLL